MWTWAKIRATCLQTHQPPGAEGSKGQSLPSSLQKECSPPPTAGFWTSGLQNCKRISFYCFKSPGCGNSLQLPWDINPNPSKETLTHSLYTKRNLFLLSDLGVWYPLEPLAKRLSPRQGPRRPCSSCIPRAQWVHTESNYAPSPPSTWGSHTSSTGVNLSPYTCYGSCTSDSSFLSLCCITEGTGTISWGCHEDSMK